MSHKTSAQIRQEFFDFFAEKNHAIVDSAPVVPKNDPTLLFTNAGMNQFKSIFLGEEEALKHDGKSWSRAADTQKCIRVSGKHNDLEEVGHDTYHHTLFEMLGNWSFGDYFKKEAIGWAWELLVDEWGLEPDRLYATVFGGDEEDGLPVDEEAIELWKSETSIDHDHILKCGKKDNFWEMGETGPCGPCSEVHIDLRSDEERKKQPGRDLVNMDDPRVMEIWNLVFIQFNRKPDASLEKLPAQHVDTGMGFERICAVLQGKTSNYDTDVFTPVINKIADMAGLTYGDDEEKDIAMRVIADHIRAVTFSIADGASPGNDGRGYVIRRILRRAIRYGWDVLDFKEPFFYKLVDVLAEQFKDVFPEIPAQKEYIVNVIRSEEKSFLKTLGQGIELFNDMVEGKDKLSGEDAFKLHDTYGFPIDLTELMARERGVEVDVEGFNKHMKEQKDRARAASNFGSQQTSNFITNTPHSKFIGYHINRIKNGVDVKLLFIDDQTNRIILDKTPFYPESGGQIADSGKIKLKSYPEKDFKIVDVQKRSDTISHYLKDSDMKWLRHNFSDVIDATFTAHVDIERRIEIQKHHTATHLVHAALREMFGNHVTQKGSLVEADYLRFDFSHFSGMTKEELKELELKVNEKIQQNLDVRIREELDIIKAKELGAMMLFGEKYDEKVRVVSIGKRKHSKESSMPQKNDYSIELCGGTHANSTGELGYLRVINESSSSSGIRRLEASCGKSSIRKSHDDKVVIRLLSEVFSNPEDAVKAAKEVVEKKNKLEKELAEQKLELAEFYFNRFIGNADKTSQGIKIVKGEIPKADSETLKQLGYDGLQKTKQNTAIVLGSKDEEEGKVYLMVALSEDLIKEKGLKAGAIVGQLGSLVGGGGGGQPNLATAGGRQPEKLGEALEKVNEIITESIQ